MLKLRDAGILPVHGVVHRAIALKIVPGQGLKLEIQGAVGQGTEAEAEQLVCLTGVDHRAGKGLPVHPQRVAGHVQPLQGIAAQLHGDVGVGKHPLEHGGIALQGHALIGVLEIPVVP